MASYLGVSDFLVRADTASVSRLCARATAPNGNTVPVPFGALAGDPILAAALLDASGEILSRCTQGDRYQDADLSGMTGTAQAQLWRLVARLAVCLLWENRMIVGDDVPRPEFYDETYKTLERIESGYKVFAV